MKALTAVAGGTLVLAGYLQLATTGDLAIDDLLTRVTVAQILVAVGGLLLVSVLLRK